jgi:hypothetical protein
VRVVSAKVRDQCEAGLGGGHQQLLGHVPLGPQVLTGDACMDTSYHGGAKPGQVADGGLGAEGGAFHSSHLSLRVVMLTLGSDSGYGCRAAAPDGGSYGGFSRRLHDGSSGYDSWSSGR